MQYEGNIIRPPSEANSIILQVSVGCSHNECTFCGAYKGVRFRVKDAADIRTDIMFAAQYCRKQKKVFLADGDALIIPTPYLVNIFSEIRQNLPWVKRISLYGNTKSILGKTLADLQRLKELGLDRIYMGLESGHNPTLKNIRKGVTAEEMIEAAAMVREAGVFFSVTVLLGIAGKINSEIHASETGMVLNRMQPNQIAVLTIMLLANTSLYSDFRKGFFSMPDQSMLLEELRILVKSINLRRVQFQANHASNYLSISGRLSRDKDKLLEVIEGGLAGGHPLKTEDQRTL